MKYFLAVLMYLVYISTVFSQTIDTAETKQIPKDSLRKPVDTVKIPFDNNMIVKEEFISSQSDYNSYNMYIWNDKRNLNEILKEYPGFWVNTFGTGSRSLLSFNGLYRVGVFRDGLQINDLVDQNFDAENISVNEIDKIEEISAPLSFLYGIQTTKAINIISKNKFQPNLFTQFRYSQDRDGALFADVFLNFPISRKMNFLFGINNHGSDGHYENGDFNFWRGRIKFDYYPSNKINFKVSYYHNKIQRGLNEGLYPSAKDTLLDPNLATVQNTDAFQRNYNYYGDIKITGNFFKNNSALTNLTLFSQNSLQEYWDEENRVNPNGIYYNENFHAVIYGLDLNQSANITPSKDFRINIIAGLRGSYLLYSYNTSPYNSYSASVFSSEQFGLYNLYSRMDLSFKNLKITPGLRVDYIDENIYLNAGGDLQYKFFIADNSFLILYGGGSNAVEGVRSAYNYLPITQSNTGYFSNIGLNYFEYGVRFGYGIFYTDIKQFYQSNSLEYSALNNNISAGFSSSLFEGYLNLNLTDKDILNAYSPALFIKSDFAYKNNTLFKNKLNLKTGFNVKFVSEMPEYKYNQRTNSFYYEKNMPISTVLDKFLIDLYVGARIGKANINLTIANILNSLFYDTRLYPNDDRGGFLRSVSRLTIVWDFWN